MSSRKRPPIRSKVVKATLANRDVLDMFHGVLGTSEGSMTLSIVHPKYLRMQGHARRFLQLLATFHDVRLMAFFPEARARLAEYATALAGQYTDSFSAPDLGAYLGPGGRAGGGADTGPERAAEGPASPAAPAAPAAPAGAVPADANVPLGDYERVPADVSARFMEVFAAVKKCSLVNTIVVACKNLVVHKQSLQNAAALKGRFLLKAVGASFAPLPDLALNFRALYIDDRIGPDDQEVVLAVLHKFYTVSHDLYDAVSAPDVDVNEFVEVIQSSVQEVQKYVPRCEEAFKKIRESVGLLRENFDGYYKDYVASSNPTIIMENFVLDVSKNTAATPTVTAQFRKIIAHYRSIAAQRAAHPKLQSIFQQVDANFRELETNSRAASAKGDSDSESSEDAPDGTDPAAAALSPGLSLPGAGPPGAVQQAAGAEGPPGAAFFEAPSGQALPHPAGRTKQEHQAKPPTSSGHPAAPGGRPAGGRAQRGRGRGGSHAAGRKGQRRRGPAPREREAPAGAQLPNAQESLADELDRTPWPPDFGRVEPGLAPDPGREGPPAQAPDPPEWAAEVQTPAAPEPPGDRADGGPQAARPPESFASPV
jgi:hypothetical protein